MGSGGQSSVMLTSEDRRCLERLRVGVGRGHVGLG